jgi:hypothetical protein
MLDAQTTEVPCRDAFFAKVREVYEDIISG